jgi:hypothetical protein
LENRYLKQSEQPEDCPPEHQSSPSGSPSHAPPLSSSPPIHSRRQSLLHAAKTTINLQFLSSHATLPRFQDYKSKLHMYHVDAGLMLVSSGLGSIQQPICGVQNLTQSKPDANPAARTPIELLKKLFLNLKSHTYHNQNLSQGS